MGVSYSIACTGQTQTVHYIYSRYKNVPMLYVQLHKQEEWCKAAIFKKLV